MQPQASTIKPLHVVIVFPVLSTTCAHVCCYFILHLHNPVAAQMDALKTFLESSMVSRRACHQSAAYGDILFRC
jgi:fructose-specific phosphotransferase system IIC component